MKMVKDNVKNPSGRKIVQTNELEKCEHSYKCSCKDKINGKGFVV
jgi:uncharacterized Fe-S cluster protein YjdI